MQLGFTFESEWAQTLKELISYTYNVLYWHTVSYSMTRDFAFQERNGVISQEFSIALFLIEHREVRYTATSTSMNIKSVILLYSDHII